jgi:hypothetical protein
MDGRENVKNEICSSIQFLLALLWSIRFPRSLSGCYGVLRSYFPSSHVPCLCSTGIEPPSGMIECLSAYKRVIEHCPKPPPGINERALPLDATDVLKCMPKPCLYHSRGAMDLQAITLMIRFVKLEMYILKESITNPLPSIAPER